MKRKKKDYKNDPLAIRALRGRKTETLNGQEVLVSGRTVRGRRGIQRTRPIPEEIMRLVENKKGEEK